MTFCLNLNCILNKWKKNKFLLGGDKFMPEMLLKQPGFTYSASGPLTKNKERILAGRKYRLYLQ